MICVERAFTGLTFLLNSTALFFTLIFGIQCVMSASLIQKPIRPCIVLAITKYWSSSKFVKNGQRCYIYGESAAEASGRPEATGYMKSKRCTLILFEFIRNYLLANISSYRSIILLRSSRHKGTNILKPSPEFVLNNSSDNTSYSH